MSESKYAIEEIFRPTSFPQYTYIDREISTDDTYELRLKKALRSPGRLISITGSSKSGKTVLCHKVIEKNSIIDLSGAQIQSQADFWNQIAEKIRLPLEVQVTQTVANKVSINARTGASGKVPFVASADISGQAGYDHSTGQNIAEKEIRSNTAIVEYLIANHKVLVLDDFHYLANDLQMYIARILKTELFNGLKAIIISLPHRADDAIRHNPDLIGRTSFIEIAPWSMGELTEIGRKGFALLRYEIDEQDLNLLAQESIASPQLMQENCFNLADRIAVVETNAVTTELVHKAFHDTVINYSHYDAILQKVLCGPAQGREKRMQYTFKDKTQADIYHLFLKGISIDPPVLSMHMDDIKARFATIIDESEKLPTSLVTSNTIMHVERIMHETAPKLDSIEWREQVLYILDPFLLFYLRWNNSLSF
ncbi:hypothetical protein [Sporomusa sp. KB1]|uniref:hypothetical protein n=1 Tax=Sporomusa sp. KB1 TaxID=943346 RepID=UPI0011A00D48|nr:hypothetical protein [Sporomusa sp. KB1]TWH48877.1 hypothetical protein Salpa_5068 [Sporomusa sp. KB1]